MITFLIACRKSGQPISETSFEIREGYKLTNELTAFKDKDLKMWIVSDACTGVKVSQMRRYADIPAIYEDDYIINRLKKFRASNEYKILSKMYEKAYKDEVEEWNRNL